MSVSLTRTTWYLLLTVIPASFTVPTVHLNVPQIYGEFALPLTSLLCKIIGPGSRCHVQRTATRVVEGDPPQSAVGHTFVYAFLDQLPPAVEFDRAGVLRQCG